MSSLNSKRNVLYNIFLHQIFNSDLKFKVLTAKNIGDIFYLYDEVFFEDEISSKIDEGKKRIKFFVRNSKGANNLNVYGKNAYSLTVHTPSVFKSKNRIVALMRIIERLIVELVLGLWGYLHADVEGIDPSAFLPGGDLEKCMLDGLFNIKRLNSKVEFGIPLRYTPPPPSSDAEVPWILENWENSCFLDSLIMVLLFSSTDYFRSGIFLHNPQRYNYKETKTNSITEEKYVELNEVCAGDANISIGGWLKRYASTHPDDPRSAEIKNTGDDGVLKFIRENRSDGLVKRAEIVTEKQTKNMAEKIQRAFFKIYGGLTSEEGENMMCYSLRSLLVNCIPDLSESRRKPYDYVQLAPHIVYNYLANLFPPLKMEGYREVFRNKKSLGRWKEVFLMQDFIEPLGERPTPLWDEMRLPALIFQNGIMPHVENFGSSESEHAASEFQEEAFAIHKARVFGEYILNGRYRLTAAIMHHGERPGDMYEEVEVSYANHYTAYIRPFFNKEVWYNYDDMGEEWEKTDDLPVTVFIDEKHNGSRPELLFYELQVDQ